MEGPFFGIRQEITCPDRHFLDGVGTIGKSPACSLGGFLFLLDLYGLADLSNLEQFPVHDNRVDALIGDLKGSAHMGSRAKGNPDIGLFVQLFNLHIASYHFILKCFADLHDLSILPDLEGLCFSVSQ